MRMESYKVIITGHLWPETIDGEARVQYDICETLILTNVSSVVEAVGIADERVCRLIDNGYSIEDVRILNQFYTSLNGPQ